MFLEQLKKSGIFGDKALDLPCAWSSQYTSLVLHLEVGLATATLLEDLK
jgi:hypothetical protein